MVKSTTKSLLDALEPYPFSKRCFARYVEWFVDNVPDEWESYDLIDALNKNKTDHLNEIENLLLHAQKILGVSQRDFVKLFGFEDDLLSKDAEKIHDILAEPLFVVDLHSHGFSEIKKLPQFIKRSTKKIPNSDFTAVRSGQTFAIELKTIRMEANPKPVPGQLLGDSTKPSWWTDMFQNNAETKIKEKNYRVFHQLKNTADEYECGKKMLVLYTRRLGTSTLTELPEYSKELERIQRNYPVLDYVVAKNYFGDVVFFPELDTKVSP